MSALTVASWVVRENRLAARCIAYPCPASALADTMPGAWRHEFQVNSCRYAARQYPLLFRNLIGPMLLEFPAVLANDHAYYRAYVPASSAASRSSAAHLLLLHTRGIATTNNRARAKRQMYSLALPGKKHAVTPARAPHTRSRYLRSNGLPLADQAQKGVNHAPADSIILGSLVNPLSDDFNFVFGQWRVVLWHIDALVGLAFEKQD